jgi:cell division protein FtsZ
LEVFHLIYQNQSNVIKVIGVGGGGSNAIHMFKQGIKGVDFIVCNTDSQALQSSSLIKFSG